MENGLITIGLQGARFKLSCIDRGDGFYGGPAGRSGRVAGHFQLQRGASDRIAIDLGSGGLRVVLKISWTSPFLIASTMCGRPSNTLLIRVTPARRHRPAFFAVPPVARMESPSSVSWRQGSIICALSDSFSDTKTVPDAAGGTPAPSCALAKAASKAGVYAPSPRRWSAFPGPAPVHGRGKRANGITASFTATCSVRVVSRP